MTVAKSSLLMVYMAELMVVSLSEKGHLVTIHLLRRINRGCIWQDDLSDTWGETRTIHLKWLHYLADVAGLITHTERGIMMTVRGWMWLELPNQTRWEWLFDAS